MLANPSYCNLTRIRKDSYQGRLNSLSGGRGLHDDDFVGRNQVQSGANPFVKQVGIEMIGLQVGDPQIERLSLRPNRFEIGVFCADLARQAQPSVQPVIALDQVVNKISSQGDADNRSYDKMRPPSQFA